jgi:hypothetical protein
MITPIGYIFTLLIWDSCEQRRKSLKADNAPDPALSVVAFLPPAAWTYLQRPMINTSHAFPIDHAIAGGWTRAQRGPAVLVGEHDAPDERTPTLQRLVDESRIDFGEAQLRSAEVLDAAVRAPPIPTKAEMAIDTLPADERAAEIATTLDLPNSDVHRPRGLRCVTWDEVDRGRPFLKPDMDVLVPAATRPWTAAPARQIDAVQLDAEQHADARLRHLAPPHLA